MQRENGGDLGWLLAFLGASFSAGALGARFTDGSVNTWYPSLRRPPWTPAGSVFGPVWTVLYVLIGTSGWLVRRQAGRYPERAAAVRRALAAWLVQLALNMAWSEVFFGQRRIGGGLLISIALSASIVVCVGLSALVSKLGAALLLPYLAWTGFATVLNGRIWQLNRRPASGARTS
jgi:tryptophan-rich sensory protein